MNRKTDGQKILFILCFIAYTAVYIGRKNYSACLSGMLSDGFIDKTAGGTAGTVFLAVYACGQLFNGLLGDRISPKVMIPVGLLGSALANILMGMNTSAALVPVIWGVNGYFCSMLWSPVMRCISEWMSEEKRSDAGVYISLTVPIGSVMSYLTCAAMMRWFGWRTAFFACSVFLIAGAAIFAFGTASISGYIKEAAAKNLELRRETAKKAAENGVKSSVPLLTLIISTGLTFAILAILFNGILKDGLDLWVPTLISEYFGMSASFSSLLTSIMPVVNLVGVVLSRRINDRYFRNEMSTSAFMFAVSAVSFIPLTLLTNYAKGSAAGAVAAVLLISITSASMLGANTMILTFIPFRFSSVGRSSSVTGFMNACSYGAASLSGVTVGLVSTHFGWNATVIAFGACAALGFAVCVAGAGFWRKGREKLL